MNLPNSLSPMCDWPFAGSTVAGTRFAFLKLEAADFPQPKSLLDTIDMSSPLTGVIVNAKHTTDHQISVRNRLQRIDRLTEWLDASIPVPGLGMTIGWDTIIGLLPGVGDLATTAMSAWIINEARHLGVSKFTLARMMANTGADALIGSVPLVGDLFDAAFKANVKNLKLLRKSLTKRGLITEDESATATVRVINP